MDLTSQTMLLKLAARYFIMNQKRTVKGSQIVAIGFISILSTIMLLQSLSSEISIISTKLDSEDLTYVIHRPDNLMFNPDQITSLMDMKSLYHSIEYSYFQEILSGYISTPTHQRFHTPIYLTNLSSLLEYLESSQNATTHAIITNDIQSLLNLNNTLSIHVEADPISISTSNYTSASQKNSVLSSGIYLDSSLLPEYHPSELILKLHSPRSVSKIIDYANDNGLDMDIIRAESKFSHISATNLTNTLFILQIAISILVLLSIMNLMNLLLLETKSDIKILVSIGYSHNQVWSIFLAIACMIGILGSILTLIISIALINLVFSFFGSFGLPFIVLKIQFSEFNLILLNSVLVTFLSSIYPSYKGVRNSL